MWESVRGNNTLFPSSVFLCETLQEKLCQRLHVVTSLDDLGVVLKGWKHLEEHGPALFDLCSEILSNSADLIEERKTNVAAKEKADKEERERVAREFAFGFSNFDRSGTWLYGLSR